MSSTPNFRQPGPSGMSGAMPPRLQLGGITKRYPAVVANSDVALTVQPRSSRSTCSSVRSGGTLPSATGWPRRKNCKGLVVI